MMRIEEVDPRNRGPEDKDLYSRLCPSEKDRERFTYVPGQFAEVSVFGKGEAPFGMASTPYPTGAP